MNPIQTLQDEHRVIEHVLDALDACAVRAVHQGKDERAGLAHFVTFFREFADACHHGKEEEILFAAMVEHGFPRDAGPIAVMLNEHQQGRALVAALSRLAASPHPWSDRQRTTLMMTVRAYNELLRQHIRKEDNVLYPMAKVRLAAVMDDLAQRFDRFEEEETGSGVHDRLHALAHELIQHYVSGQGLAHSHG